MGIPDFKRRWVDIWIFELEDPSKYSFLETAILANSVTSGNISQYFS